MCLRRNHLQHSVNPLQRLPHEEHPAFEIDVLPTQSQDLSATQSGRKSDNEHGLKPITFEVTEKCSRFGRPLANVAPFVTILVAARPSPRYD